MRDFNNMSEIEDLRAERMHERSGEKQSYHQALQKVIILGDTGKCSLRLSLHS